MRFLNPIFRGVAMEAPPFLTSRSLAGKALLLGVPILASVLIPVFFVVGDRMEKMVNSAISRNAQLQARSMSFALENALVETRNKLLLLAAGSMEKGEMTRRLKAGLQNSGMNVREVAYMGLEPEDCYLLLNYGGEIVSVSPAAARDAPGAPFHADTSPQQQAPGQVVISQPMEVSYPMLAVNNSMRSVFFHVLRFSTPVHDGEGRFMGILSLALDLGALRDRLSMFFPADRAAGMASGPGQSFFFDRDGWMLFQSENPGSNDKPLNLDVARAGFSGDFGRPGFSRAFRPSPEHLDYWTIVAEVQGGGSGMLGRPVASSSGAAEYSRDGGVSYAPVTFQPGPGQPPQVIGGVAVLDDSFAAGATALKVWGMFGLAFLAAMVLLAICLWLMTRVFCRKLLAISEQIDSRNLANEAYPLEIRALPLELEKFRDGVNGLLQRLARAKAAQQSSAAARNEQWRRQAARNLPRVVHAHAAILVGESRPMRELYAQIAKAAQVSADVLVNGETGTGKELVASAIHSLSGRSGGPFISINCGALDEALLMDTLFGHVKGAFTEARADRKGAFLAAMGGTLLLDEVGNAAPKVQQALLRALSTRHIRPLGSDVDVPFNTRIIAATNASLLGEGQSFRNDLYYRLAVITIETPPLRERMEDIPALVVHFMAMAAADGGKAGKLASISHGALEKLQSHSWPGNVRELKNVITRAMAFCDGSLIMAEDLQIELAATRHGQTSGERGVYEGRENALKDNFGPQPCHDLLLEKLNPRQRKLWPALAAIGSVSRQEYQKLAGASISSRTAQYDLKLMVKLGLLRPEGRGPSQRYQIMEPDGQNALAGKANTGMEGVLA